MKNFFSNLIDLGLLRWGVALVLTVGALFAVLLIALAFLADIPTERDLDRAFYHGCLTGYQWQEMGGDRADMLPLVETYRTHGLNATLYVPVPKKSSPPLPSSEAISGVPTDSTNQ